MSTARHFTALNRLHGLQADTALAGARMDAMRPRFQRLAARHENGTAPKVITAFQLFQTPPELARRLVGLLDLQPGESVLEPSAGLGRLIDAMPDCVEITAIEFSESVAAELVCQGRANVAVTVGDFLTMKPDDFQQFHAVATNPPFHRQADIRHILHAVKFLRPGGRLAGLCMAGEIRERELRPLCSTWETVPRGTFRSEGTDVETILFTIQN